MLYNIGILILYRFKKGYYIMRVKKLLLFLLIMYFSFVPVYTKAYAETKNYTKNFNQSSVVFQSEHSYRITFSMKKEGSYSGYMLSPDGTKYPMKQYKKRYLICAVKNYVNGDWTIHITNRKGTIGQFTMTAKEVAQRDSTGQVSVTREITGFNYHFFDGKLVCAWNKRIGDNIYLTLTDTATNEQIGSVNVSDDSTYTFDIPETTNTVLLTASNSSSASMDGSGNTYTLDVIRKFDDVNVSFPTGEYVSSNAAVMINLGKAYTVSAYVNDANVIPEQAVQAGSSTINIPVSGDDGPVTLRVVAKDSSNNEVSYSQGYTKDATAPTLTMAGEYDGMVVPANKVTIEGTVKDCKTLKINDINVIPEVDGTFSQEIDLHESLNQITVTAVDEAGNETTENMSIIVSETNNNGAGAPPMTLLLGGALVIIVIVVIAKKKPEKRNRQTRSSRPKNKKKSKPKMSVPKKQEEVEYVDEDGNPIDPSELGDDVEFVDEDGNPVNETEEPEYDDSGDDTDDVEYEYVDEDGNPVDPSEIDEYEIEEDDEQPTVNNIAERAMSVADNLKNSFNRPQKKPREQRRKTRESANNSGGFVHSSNLRDSGEIQKRDFSDLWGVLKCIIACVITFYVFTHIIGLHYVPTGSMIPFIQKKDICISYRLAYKDAVPKRGDVITFTHGGEPLVKRVIGLPDETISFKNGDVYIDGRKYDESGYLSSSVKTESQQEFTVPSNCVFCLGDNREHSLDSRFWDNPYVPYSEITDKVYFVIPVHKLGKLLGTTDSE